MKCVTWWYLNLKKLYLKSNSLELFLILCMHILTNLPEFLISKGFVSPVSAMNAMPGFLRSQNKSVKSMSDYDVDITVVPSPACLRDWTFHFVREMCISKGFGSGSHVLYSSDRQTALCVVMTSVIIMNIKDV